MSDEQPEATEETQEKKSGGKKKLIMIVLPIVVVLAGAAGFFLRGGDTAEAHGRVARGRAGDPVSIRRHEGGRRMPNSLTGVARAH